jgi:tetratricopeptide (TPR) repeat protein
MWLGRYSSALVLVVVLTVLAACRTAAPPAPPTRVADPLPPPLSARPLTKSEVGAVYAALAAAERGDGVAARRALGRAPTNHPAVALALLEVRFLLGERVGDEAERLAQSQGDYRQAYSFAAQALQVEGRFANALAAARRALQLGGGTEEARRVRELEAVVLGGALELARAALASGDGEGAVTVAREALDLVPGAVSLLEVLVRGYLLTADVQAAARLVTALPDDGDGLELKGRVAAAGGQWDVAAELFARLPADHPGRCVLLQDARRRVRLRQAPPYVQRALGSTNLTRAELAALVVWEVPAVQEQARGAVTVFEDIVNLAERRDVVAVVRAGVMDGDPVTRRFSPHRRVRSRELMAVTERLVEVLGRPPLPWCGEDRRDACLEIPGEVVTGAAASALLRRVALEGEDVCQ